MVDSRTTRFTETVRSEAAEQADTARQELGEVVLDVTDDIFPEAAMKRRRRDFVGGFVLGVATGFLVRHALGE